MGRRSGDACEQPGCDGHLVTYSTRERGDRRIRYLQCCKCAHKPRGNKWVIPLAYARATRRSA